MTDEPAVSDDERESASAAEPPGGGVFGNLPHSRVGARSPRRRRDTTRAGPASDRTTQAKAASEPDDDREPGPEATADEPDEQGSGIEDLAWAGVAAAAEAATLGVRLANRALGAVRDTIERR